VTALDAAAVAPPYPAALPVAVDPVLYGAYVAAWAFFAFGPQLVICMLFAWAACRRARGDLLVWLTKGFLWSLLPFVGVAAMWWLWRRTAGPGRPGTAGEAGGPGAAAGP
jgi:hypothetical protein